MQYTNVTVMDLQVLRKEKSEREGRREFFGRGNFDLSQEFCNFYQMSFQLKQLIKSLRRVLWKEYSPFTQRPYSKTIVL